MGWQGRIGDAVKVRGMFLHPRQVADFMTRFPEVIRWQAVITREEHKDHLALYIVAGLGVDTASLPTNLAQTAREAIKFHLEVKIVSEESLPSVSGEIHDPGF